MIRLCIWMDIPSHHQSAFFLALNRRRDINLIVIYLKEVSKERAAEGWKDVHEYQIFEYSAAGINLNSGLDDLLPDWQERIHVVSSYISSELINIFCKKGVPWCHWSEMPGIRLAELLHYCMSLYRLLNPLMLLCKRSYGQCIKKNALGAFGQGLLARKTFRLMGVPDKRIYDLYYTPSALTRLNPSGQIVQFAAGRKVFLTVGALCKRKGIDILLKAFSRLKTTKWCLVLCGLDKLNGQYKKLSRKLGIEDQVLFLGPYASHRIAEVYYAADVFVLASRFDGWGAVLNEAASAGLPLISTDNCGAAWHLVQNDENGYRVKAGSVGELALRMNIYVTSPGLIESHGCISKEIFFRDFTPERNAERFVDGLSIFIKHRHEI